MKFLFQAILLSFLTNLSSILAAAIPSTATGTPSIFSPYINVTTLWPDPSTLPAPINAVAANTNKRSSEYHLYNCYDLSFTGRCLNMDANINQCYNLVDGWANQITSSGPDKENFMCVLFTTENCQVSNTERAIVWPGYGDLRKIGIDDAAKSFRCTNRW